MPATTNPPTAPPASSGASTGLNFAVPVATDLGSALQAIRIMSVYMGQLAALLNSTGLGGNPGTFRKVAQTVTPVTIVDPNDASIAIEVDQVTTLVMENSKTGEKWIWQL